MRAFIAENNRPALSEIAARFREAIDRGLWAPALNSAYDRLSALIAEASSPSPGRGGSPPSGGEGSGNETTPTRLARIASALADLPLSGGGEVGERDAAE